MNTIEVIFDGKAFIPAEPVQLAPGTRLTLTIGPALHEHPEGSPELPWATVEDAVGYARARPGYHFFPDVEESAEDRP